MSSSRAAEVVADADEIVEKRAFDFHFTIYFALVGQIFVTDVGAHIKSFNWEVDKSV